MAMRSQVYEWTNLAPTTNGSNIRQSSNPTQVEIAADKSLDIFIGGKGTNITQPASTTATQFVVIEDIAASPQAGGALNVRINTTDYFQNPDVTQQAGVPGLASPYPRGTSSDGVMSPTAGDNVLPSFSLTPEVYVLPGQTWSVLYQCTSALGGGGIVIGADVPSSDAVAAFVKYTLYDGPDSLIRNKLLEMGITVNPSNVDWYKRSLLEQQSRAAMATPNGGA
jgi:hypothetical protein|tara:strand:- start:9119 stop:9790 length:672 start_codon:yes stop_codon:yes gene_type:complete